MRTFLLGLCFCGAGAAATIYRCPGEESGVPLYTDRPCAGGVEQPSQATSVLGLPPLTEAEESMLDRIGRRSAPSTPPARHHGVHSTDECAAARNGLADIRQTRRRGYRLRDAQALDRRESALRAQAARVCVE